MPTPKQLLLELSYQGDLPKDVERMVTDRKSWREIAREVSAGTGFSVSHESLRQWYGAQQTGTRAA